MAIENDFLPFAVGAGANVLPQADYAALAAVSQGFQSGTAQSAACNKAWRQSSIMSAVLAQFIVAQSGQPAIDDGTTATLLANLTAALSTLAQTAAPGRLLNVQVFTVSGTYTPTPGTQKIVVKAVGGGGAGGGSQGTSSTQSSGGSGGAAGSWAEALIPSGFAGAAVTIGAAGLGAVGANGGNGSTTSFGSLVTCPGGGGGQQGIWSTSTATLSFAGQGIAGAFPTVSGSAQLLAGGYGSPGSNVFVAGGNGVSGSGGASVFGGGGGNTNNNVGSGLASPGAGGGGAFSPISSAAQAGGNGGPGRMEIWEYA
ncbi:hypothetical protein [Burkholderia cenocepacia]|uniref:glycine-rich domain-containing protein n=1 Tax=Burkholderia cenocepacia TaxID=95486 RepID=UPI002012DB9C|nr:hypothetical protein [Burkholderia cenocepacia]